MRVPAAMADRQRAHEWPGRLPKFVRWMEESAARLDTKRVVALAAARKRDRDSSAEMGHGGASASSGPPESLPPPGAAGGASSSRVRPQGEPSERDEDLSRFRHANLVAAGFAPQRHLFMCCGRPIVVLWANPQSSLRVYIVT